MPVGTACRVRQLLRQPGGKSIRVMVEGIGRGRIASMATDVPCLYCEIDPEPDIPEKPSVRTEALCRRCVSLFGQYSEAVGNSPSESIITMAASGDPGYIADFAAQNVYLKPDEKQQLHEEVMRQRDEDSRSATRMIEQLVAKNQEAERAHEEQIQDLIETLNKLDKDQADRTSDLEGEMADDSHINGIEQLLQYAARGKRKGKGDYLPCQRSAEHIHLPALSHLRHRMNLPRQ